MYVCSPYHTSPISGIADTSKKWAFNEELGAAGASDDTHHYQMWATSCNFYRANCSIKIADPDLS